MFPGLVSEVQASPSQGLQEGLSEPLQSTVERAIPIPCERTDAGFRRRSFQLMFDQNPGVFEALEKHCKEHARSLHLSALRVTQKFPQTNLSAGMKSRIFAQLTPVVLGWKSPGVEGASVFCPYG